MNTEPRHPARAAFTLIELLVVVAVILILAAIGAVAASRVSAGAEDARVRSQVSAIAQGVQAFVNDFQFEPPLVVDDEVPSGRGILTPEIKAARAGGNVAQNLATEYQRLRYHSRLTLPIYLLGIGDLNADGRVTYAPQPNLDDGLDGPGLRNPGDSRAWKKADGSGDHEAVAIGREYGPYIDPGLMKDSLRQIRFGNDGRPSATGNVFLHEFVDYRGNPIRYYRNWPTRTPDGKPTLARVPPELRSAESIARQLDLGLGNTDASILDLDRDALNARYCVMVIRDQDQAVPGDIAQDFNPGAINDVDKTRLKNITKRTVRVFP